MCVCVCGVCVCLYVYVCERVCMCVRVLCAQIVASVVASGYLMVNYENADGREHAFSGVG